MFGVIGSIINSIGNYEAQQAANDTNLQIARETNRQQYDMFKEQLGYQTAERLATQEYNSPVHQRQLYEQAGINPYAVLGNMNSETVAQSAPSAPSQHVAQVQPANLAGSLGSGIADGFSRMLNNESLGLDNDSKRIDLMFKTSEKLLDIDSKIADLQHKRNLNDQDKVQLASMQHQRDMLNEQLDVLRSTKSELKRQERFRSESMRLDNAAKQLANDYQSWKNQYEKQFGEKQLELIDKQVMEVLSQIALNRSMSAKAAAETALTNLQKQGVKLDNQQKKLLRGHVMKMARLEEEGQKLNNELTRYNTGVNGKDWLRMGESIFAPLFGYALGRFGAVKGAANVKGVQAVPRTPTIYY